MHGLVELGAPSFASFTGGVESSTVNTSLCESCSRRLVRARSIEGHRGSTSVSNNEPDPCCSSRERPPQAGRGGQVGLSIFRQQRRHGAARRHERLKVIAHGPACEVTTTIHALRRFQPRPPFCFSNYLYHHLGLSIGVGAPSCKKASLLAPRKKASPASEGISCGAIYFFHPVVGHAECQTW